MADDRLKPRKIKPKPERPQIWAEGSQKPKFDARAFAVASLHLTRDGIAPLIARTATGTAALSTRVAEGTWRVPTARLGRAERFVPSHQTVASWIAATAHLIDAAASSAAPESHRRRDRFARTAPVQAPEPPQPAADMPTAPVTLPEPPQEDAETLAAIRSALEDTPATNPAAPPSPPGTKAQPSALADTLTSAAGTALGWTLIAAALPYGIVRATLAHLNGEDLRQIRDDD
ncbi:hypothetical protein [Tabrizicola sp. BL-A-41-H6]|uniref:hypothetical protein n=1 Tax=Tabrizicola sp. BL-A-41-H6 TaxID=3421107 RepID=UPI003D67836F